VSPGTLYQRPELHTYLDAPVDAHHRDLIGVLLARFGLAPGQRVLEIGAGSGRYTRSLVDHGLRVIAAEPDPVLGRKLQEQAACWPGVTVLARAAGQLSDAAEVEAVCGFHILHHLDEGALRALCRDLARIAARSPGFRGFFFMEPNPLNPLYLVQILLHPGMRFREEKGIWRRDYGRIFAGEGLELRVLGHLGLIPPAACRLLSVRWQRLLVARLRPGRSLAALYRILGSGPAAQA
jgi:hypothetical protein